MAPLEDGLAASLSGIWSALHKDAPLTVRDSERRYLQMLALAADNDLVSLLLLRKLRLARVVNACAAPDRVVYMNSFLEFRFDASPTLFCQLVHPSRYAPSYGVSILSLIGAGLLGVGAGQTILWPDERGTLCDLEVRRVENCPTLAEALGGGCEVPQHA